MSEEDADLILTWLIAARQYVQGSDNQALPLDIQPVLNHEEEFLEWARNHASNYLGEMEF